MNAKAADPIKKVDFTWGLKIPMRDGFHLNATLYRPMDSAPVPLIITLTPYIGDSYHPRAYYFAQHGYAFALVDCRGRGNSEGTFEPFQNEEQDGHDLVEWLGVQPWCTGQVTMWGGSYGGYDQWMTLKSGPAHLKTIVPVASAHAGVDFPFFKNIQYSYEIQWQTLTSGVTSNANLFEQESFWIEKFRQMYLEHRPYQELDQIVGNLNSTFQTFVQHPHQDAFWDILGLAPADYDRIDLPILSITGHYDGDQPGALHFYRLHMQSASPSRDRHYLVIGPWDHPGTRTPAREFAGLTFGEASLLDMNKLHQEWYDWTMRDGKKPEFLKKPVAYYLAGAEEWKYADSLETIANYNLRLYLASHDSLANDVFQSGSLAETPSAAAAPDRYVYDPLDTRPEELERAENKNYLSDQRYELNLYGNGLVYHSQPFEAETDLAGCLKLTAWISLDVPDTDFLAVVSEILPDGSHIQLSQDLLRARYRQSLRQETLVPPGDILPYEFSGFTFFARRLARGSRLRLVLSCPNSIFYQKNYNSGGVVAAESAKDARTAHITLYHDPEHPSCLEVPVVKNE
jgi:putative CocE/NonD family hydrolase